MWRGNPLCEGACTLCDLNKAGTALLPSSPGDSQQSKVFPCLF